MQRALAQIRGRDYVSLAPSSVEKGVSFNRKDNHHHTRVHVIVGSPPITLLKNTNKTGGMNSMAT